MPEYLRCKSGFMLPDRTIVKGGQIVRADDRVVKGREREFEPAEPVIETATRAPSERRLLPKREPDAVVMEGKKRRGRPPKNAEGES